MVTKNNRCKNKAKIVSCGKKRVENYQFCIFAAWNDMQCFL